MPCRSRRALTAWIDQREVPTWLLLVVIYGGWMGLTYFYAALPWWVLLPAGGWITAWHMSLQHEIVHCHPTRSRAVNTMLGFPPFSLWLPFERYRATHLAHHNDRILTDPIEDPESAYVTPAQWDRLSAFARLVLTINSTLAGRMTIGPVLVVGEFLRREARLLVAAEPKARQIWLLHGLGVAAVLSWTVFVCGISIPVYIAFFIYPGLSLTLLRSFAEHRAAEQPAHRTAIVEHAPVLGLLFLYNNLHVAHHQRPGLPWYSLPSHYKANRAALVVQNNGLVYDGYRDVARRYFFARYDGPVHSTSESGQKN